MPQPLYVVSAHLDVDSGLLSASWQARVPVNAGQSLVRLWVYADRLATTPAGFRVDYGRWFFPAEVDLQQVKVLDLAVDGQNVQGRWLRGRQGSAGGRETAGADLAIKVIPGPARSLNITLKFHYVLPERFGRLGRNGEQYVLAGPWYPLVLAPGQDMPSELATHQVTLRTSRRADILLASEMTAGRARTNSRGLFVPALVSSTLHHRARTFAGTQLKMWSASSLYQAPATNADLSSLHDAVRIDTIRHVEQAARSAVATAHAVGIEQIPSTLRVVVVPSRDEIAATAPGWVIVSDRLFEIFPMKQAQTFHQQALLQAFFQYFAQAVWTTVESPDDSGWSREFRAALLLRVDEWSKKLPVKTPYELLKFAAFHPTIDQLLYAPQMAFANVYFKSSELPLSARDDPWLARSHRATGVKVWENLQTRLPYIAFQKIAMGALVPGQRLRDLIKDVAPKSAALLGQWLNPNPLPVNYRLGRIESRKLQQGGFEHRIEVVREGGRREDPVQVWVKDDDGKEAFAQWDGHGQRGWVSVRTAATLDSVDVDPQGRLYQSPEMTVGHPHADDTTDLPFRPPLLQGFGFNASLGDKQVTGFVDFALRRRYDLENGVVLRLEHSVSTSGGSLRYVRGFGPKAHNNRRIGYASFGGIFERLRSSFGEDQPGGWNAGIMTAFGTDDRTFMQDPREGLNTGVYAQTGWAFADGVSGSPYLSVSARAGQLIPMGLRNVLLIVGGGGYTFGEVLPNLRQALGGRFLLRAYPVDALVGRGRLYAVAEHRYTLLSDLHWNGLHLAWVREVQLAAFAGGGLLFQATDGEGLREAAEVGAGLRIHSDYGGVQPAVFAMDFALPLVQVEDRDTRQPFGFFVSFDQYF